MLNKNDPLIGSVVKAMQLGEKQRQAETSVCEQMGIQSRKALPHERQAEYDARVKAHLTESKDDKEYGVDTEREMAKKGKMLPDVESDDKAVPFKKSHKVSNPEKAPARSHLKAMIKKARKTVSESDEMGSTKKRENPQTYKHKTSGKEISSVKHPGKDWELVKEEQLNELKKSTVRRYTKKAIDDKKATERQSEFSAAHANNPEHTPKKREEFRQEAEWLKGIAAKRQRGLQMASNRLRNEEEQLDELKKSTLASYIKKASHDVATRSAAVRGFARDAEQQRKDMKPMDARKSEARAEKTFMKSWKRREGIAKAADRLAAEETISEKAPPGAKYERMVKDIKAGYAKDGLTDKERAIAYATAWKAKNKKKVTEAITLDSVLDEISHNLGVNIRELDEGVLDWMKRNLSWSNVQAAKQQNRDRATSSDAALTASSAGAPGSANSQAAASAIQATKPPKNYTPEQQARMAKMGLNPQGQTQGQALAAANRSGGPEAVQKLAGEQGKRDLLGSRIGADGKPDVTTGVRAAATDPTKSPDSTPRGSPEAVRAGTNVGTQNRPAPSPDENITPQQSRQIANPAAPKPAAPRPAAPRPAAPKPDTSGVSDSDFQDMIKRGSSNTPSGYRVNADGAVTAVGRAAREQPDDAEVSGLSVNNARTPSAPTPAPKPQESRWKPPSFNNQDVMPGSG